MFTGEIFTPHIHYSCTVPCVSRLPPVSFYRYKRVRERSSVMAAPIRSEPAMASAMAPALAPSGIISVVVRSRPGSATGVALAEPTVEPSTGSHDDGLDNGAIATLDSGAAALWAGS